ncbi:uncharacterized protein N7443_002850 [Penicillium atrosanguineum]|uniref:NmrA-like domain-containing protein n=1 Tax=Penicillium atrosanguineum TaxID=1132637 RepID=A0A9W9PX72_9EURO|nr:uncharacterized protein N7443_002850 [Penicillium atrosanguineum]KAJ5310389.1 hypothetical protein N7443_002850 [Penicillium atrosanguineum]KAJ5315910.1 hypothetical protein N7476_006217 [Penicillium atrosanguineum]
MTKTVLIIGGTGAQGIPVVKGTLDVEGISKQLLIYTQALATDSKFKIRVLTRSASSKDAKDLASLPGVSIFEGEAYDEATLRQAFKDIDLVFANTNGFAIGEKSEIYWGIRLYELAREHKVAHFVYAGLGYASKLGNFDPKYRCGHLDGKGKVVDYIFAQSTSKMAWSVLTSCMYLDSLSEFLRPFPDPKDPDTMVFTAPLGNGKCPLIYLEDYGRYARWIFDNPAQSNGRELNVATEDLAWNDLAAAFSDVTGKKAVYRDVTLDEYFKLGILDPNAIVGHSSDPNDTTLQTYRENFSGFWNTWKDNLTKRDYELLDTILPTRVKSVKEWMEMTGYSGKPSSLLKDYRDRAAKK